MQFVNLTKIKLPFWNFPLVNIGRNKEKTIKKKKTL